MVRTRRGAGTLGCLFSLFVVAALGYFGLHIGQAYLRAARFEDRMKGEIRFAGQKSTAEIKERLIVVADSLGLPEEAHDINVSRTGATLAIWVDYTELIELPFHGQRLPFHPHAEGRVDTGASK